MSLAHRQSGKVGIIILVVLLIVGFIFRDSLLGLFADSSGPDVLSVESFDCQFALGGAAGVSGPAGGVAGQFNIVVLNLSDEYLTDIFVEVTARHPDSRSNTHSLVTQLSPARLQPGRLGRFKGPIAAAQMAAANASVEKMVCLMEIGRMVDGELQPFGVRINSLDLVPATAVQAQVIL